MWLRPSPFHLSFTHFHLTFNSLDSSIILYILFITNPLYFTCMGTNKEGRMSGQLGLCGDCVGFCRSCGGLLG